MYIHFHFHWHSQTLQRWGSSALMRLDKTTKISSPNVSRSSSTSPMASQDSQEQDPEDLSEKKKGEDRKSSPAPSAEDRRSRAPITMLGNLRQALGKGRNPQTSPTSPAGSSSSDFTPTSGDVEISPMSRSSSIDNTELSPKPSNMDDMLSSI